MRLISIRHVAHDRPLQLACDAELVKTLTAALEAADAVAVYHVDDSKGLVSTTHPKCRPHRESLFCEDYDGPPSYNSTVKVGQFVWAELWTALANHPSASFNRHGMTITVKGGRITVDVDRSISMASSVISVSVNGYAFSHRADRTLLIGCSA